MYIDTHCHLYKEYYDDVDLLISNCIKNDVHTFIVSGCDINSSIETLDLANKYQEVYATVGFHPTELKEYSDNWFSWLKEHLHDEKVVAIGEIGLDYHYEDTDKEKEIMVFEKQLKLAQEEKIPVVIHSRDATLDTLNILKKYHVKGIIHGFSGSLETANEYVKLGFKLGVNGVITFKNAHLKEIIKEIGLQNIVLETDSPYLTPEPIRGHQNTPSNLKYIVSFLADYLNISQKTVLDITNQNALEILPKLNK